MIDAIKGYYRDPQMLYLFAPLSLAGTLEGQPMGLRQFQMLKGIFGRVPDEIEIVKSALESEEAELLRKPWREMINK